MKIKGYKHSVTVGDLLDFIEKYNIPRDGKVLIQRIEDSYFEGSDISGMTGQLADGTWGKLPVGSKATPWKTVDIPGFEYYQAIEMNKKVDAGEIAERFRYSNEILKKLYDKYIVAWSPVKHDEDNLYIDAHY